MLNYFNENLELASLPEKHANFWLDITLWLKYLWCLIEKCRLNSTRHPSVCYKSAVIWQKEASASVQIFGKFRKT